MKHLHDLVPNVAICQKLKDAGFRQDTLLFWRVSKDSNNYESHVVAEINGNYYRDKIAAPTLGEIEMPSYYVIEKVEGKYFPCEYEIFTNSYYGVIEINDSKQFDTEIEARAALWLYLNENKQ